MHPLSCSNVFPELIHTQIPHPYIIFAHATLLTTFAYLYIRSSRSYSFLDRCLSIDSLRTTRSLRFSVIAPPIITIKVKNLIGHDRNIRNCTVIVVFIRSNPINKTDYDSRPGFVSKLLAFRRSNLMNGSLTHRVSDQCNQS